MAETAIEWADYTFNPWIGCTKVSEECTHCYAEADQDTRRGRVKWGPSGTRSRTSDAYWGEPLRWNRAAARAGARRRVFCASLADVFEDWEGPILDAAGKVLMAREDVGEPSRPLRMSDLREELFFLMANTPHLDWLLLTKRPANMADGLPWHSGLAATRAGDPALGAANVCLPNIWAGVSVGVRKTLPRIDTLRTIQAPLRFLSIEPLLEDLGELNLTGIHWVIVGGESGPRARVCDLAWIRSVVKQCLAAKVPVLVKQIGSEPRLIPLPSGMPHHFVKHPKGGDPAEWPEDLRVREFPTWPAA